MGDAYQKRYEWMLKKVNYSFAEFIRPLLPPENYDDSSALTVMAEALDEQRHNKVFLITSRTILQSFKPHVSISDVLSEMCRHDVVFPLVFMIHKLMEDGLQQP